MPVPFWMTQVLCCILYKVEVTRKRQSTEKENNSSLIWFPKSCRDNTKEKNFESIHCRGCYKSPFWSAYMAPCCRQGCIYKAVAQFYPHCLSCKYVSLADKKTDYTEFAGVVLFFFSFTYFSFSNGGRMLRSRGLGCA